MDESFEEVGVGVGKVHDHFPEEGVCPGEPLSCYLGGVVHWKRFVHQVVFGWFYQAVQAVSDLVRGLRCQDLGYEGQRPDVARACVWAAHPADLPSRVEKLITLGKYKFSSVLVGLIFDINETKVRHAQNRWQIGIIVNAVATRPIYLICEDVFPSFFNDTVFEDSLFDAVRVAEHLLCDFFAEWVVNWGSFDSA